MRSSDYLYDLLKRHPNEGWYIGRKRYTIGTSKIDGKWKEAVCSCFRDSLHVIGNFYSTSEEAWEAFLTVHYPKMMQKWREKEDLCSSGNSAGSADANSSSPKKITQGKGL